MAVIVVGAESPAEPGGNADDISARVHYRPQLDGLRAVAVYLVVAFHAGIRSFSGGFVGVDVFFVLSGYLVTQLLMRDVKSSGRIDFRRFYSRRFRRLLPAAFVALIVTTAIYAAVAAPVDVSNAVGGIRSAFLYFANWHFISQSNDYFAANVNTNPVVHFWSLAIEEQFYLLWPLILGVAYLIARRVGSRPWRSIRLLVALGLIVSVVDALHTARSDLARAYYGTDTRAYELLAGAFLAMTPQLFQIAKRHRQTLQRVAPLVFAALIVFATSAVHVGAITRGVAITVVTCALIVAIEVSNSTGMIRRALSSRTMGYLGRISYGTYLWHWPVIVIATLRFHPNGVALFLLTCLIGTGIASLSYQVLERPVRASPILDVRKTAVIAAGLALSIIGGLVVAPAILNRHRTSAASILSSASASNGGWRIPVPQNLDWNAIKAQSYGGVACFRKAIDGCIVARGSGPRVVLIGDSHALTLIPTMTEIAKRHSLTLAVLSLPNCTWERDVIPAPVLAPTSLFDSCRAHQDDWYNRVVPQFNPAVIILASRAYDDPASPESVRDSSHRKINFGDAAYERTLIQGARSTIDGLRVPGRKIVIIRPMPLAPAGFDPFSCLSSAKFLEDCRYVATTAPTPLEGYYASIADAKKTWLLDFDELVCPYFPICDPVVERTVVKKDPQHLTAAYAKLIAGPVGDLLVRERIIR